MCETTDSLMKRIAQANGVRLLDWLQALTEDLENADKFSDDVTGASAERGLVRNEVLKRMGKDQ